MYKGKQTTTEAATSIPTPERLLVVMTNNTNTSKTQVETRHPNVKTKINTYRQHDDSNNNDMTEPDNNSAATTIKSRQTTTEAATSTPTPERLLVVITNNTNTSKTQVETRQPSVKTKINTYRQRDDSINNDMTEPDNDKDPRT